MSELQTSPSWADPPGRWSTGCGCVGTQSERRAHWVVTAYRCNYSAFNGYRRTPSDYSEVHCRRCNSRWRTKAAYVDRLASIG